MRDYVEISYRNLPYTDYPLHLADYLMKRYGMKCGQKILDVGCGRGEYLKGFNTLGLKAYGVDMNTTIAEKNLSMKSYSPQAKEIRQTDFTGTIPWSISWATNTFDWILVKSVIEHLYYPENLLEDCCRILKKGGGLIVMTPNCEKSGTCFFTTFQHRTPFVMGSLAEVMELAGFDDIEIEKFVQVPYLWKHPRLTPIFKFIAYTMPFIKSSSLKYSKGYTLLATGKKPKKRKTKWQKEL